MANELKDALFKATTAVHRAVFRASKGRVAGRALGMTVVELVTTGRKSGRPRSTMLTAPIASPDQLVLVASFGGDDRHPAWYLNLRANPKVTVTAAGSTRPMIARVASEAERADLWPRVTTINPGYAKYQTRTTRTIPLVLLEPA
ncbi:nitroreductase family deazaflavin-dependent oxidoreductase [Flindersiella endophytica]